MYEYENNYLSFVSPEKVVEFNADNDVHGHDNDIYKKMGRKHVWNNKNPHWHTLSKSSNSQSEQHYPTFTRGKLFFPRNRKEALDMNYKHWVNFLSAAGNVSIESDSRNIHPELLVDHMDILNWHCVNMMPVHSACAPIQLTAIVQINYFATYKFRRTVDKFYVLITVEQLTSGQKDEEKTVPGYR